MSDIYTITVPEWDLVDICADLWDRQADWFMRRNIASKHNLIINDMDTPRCQQCARLDSGIHVTETADTLSLKALWYFAKSRRQCCIVLSVARPTKTYDVLTLRYDHSSDFNIS